MKKQPLPKNLGIDLSHLRESLARVASERWLINPEVDLGDNRPKKIPQKPRRKK